ncbi:MULTISPECIES: phage tail tube protein [Trueperella]|uniref:Uncharacterized protein n=1 Tax=Trueperella abortisuis TaxID=445930 RepID=A0ABT9PKK7_9ACTO|nr:MULTISPECIES: hypothetical protein [Trueperella]MCI7306152.1 hypothetical protein [Trueperella sp.]MDP9832996.1 hypothetical protein [Trueperella abortisuis]MDY5404392.1 hypothetical protein [Trueperella sp.]
MAKEIKRGPKTLADARTKLTVLTVRPKNMKAITVAELTAGYDIQDFILKSDFQLGPSGSSTISEIELGAPGEGQAFGLSAGSGHVTIFRYLDQDGKPDPEADVVFSLFKTKGTELTLVRRDGAPAGQAWKSGDEYSAFEVTNDDPQFPADGSGYIKRPVPLAVGAMHLDQTVAEA